MPCNRLWRTLLGDWGRMAGYAYGPFSKISHSRSFVKRLRRTPEHGSARRDHWTGIRLKRTKSEWWWSRTNSYKGRETLCPAAYPSKGAAGSICHGLNGIQPARNGGLIRATFRFTHPAGFKIRFRSTGWTRFPASINESLKNLNISNLYVHPLRGPRTIFSVCCPMGRIWNPMSILLLW